MQSVLEGVNVLDLTRVVAGPACTRTLADYGATVWKIEPPQGDLMRRGQPRANGVALSYAQQNAGKYHLCVDLSQHSGQELVMELANKADIVVENYRPGVAERLGLGYEAVKERNPSIVYCSISGYGQTGSAANRRAYAPIIHAELGLVALNARERDTEPMPESVSHVDFAVGSQACSAILAALFMREQTGQGQRIDVSMAETMLATNEFATIEINGGLGDEISPFRPGKAAILRLGDGSSVQVPGNPTTWIFGMARALGKAEQLNQRGWISPKEIQGQEAEVVGLMQSWADDFVDIRSFEQALDSAKVPLGQVQELSEALKEPWVKEREAVVPVDVNGAQRSVPRSPTRFSAGTTGPQRGAYLRGHDNRQIFGEVLGLSDAEIDRLYATGTLTEEDVAQ